LVRWVRPPSLSESGHMALLQPAVGKPLAQEVQIPCQASRILPSGIFCEWKVFITLAFIARVRSR
jgi:hypothetical protein